MQVKYETSKLAKILETMILFETSWHIFTALRYFLTCFKKIRFFGTNHRQKWPDKMESFCSCCTFQFYYSALMLFSLALAEQQPWNTGNTLRLCWCTFVHSYDHQLFSALCYSCWFPQTRPCVITLFESQMNTWSIIKSELLHQLEDYCYDILNIYVLNYSNEL